MKRKINQCLPGRALIKMFLLMTALFCGMHTGAQSDTVSVSIQQILDAHNAYRTEVGVPALTWSDELAQYAQSWATEVAANRSCQMQHRPADASDPWNEKYGENIYWGGGTGWSPTVLDAVADWGTEKNDFDFNIKDCKNGAECGHYTQMIWKKTTKVGCGIAKCADGNVIVVCNYNPPGNFGGEKPY
jgi:pathogenesis-related protein 1